MKKLHHLSTTFIFILIIGFLGCKKETANSPLQEEIPAAKPPAPPPPTSILQWQKTYGGPLNEMGFSITRSSDGNGYVFAASTLGDGGDVTGHHGATTSADVWVVKTDNSGAILWKKCIGGTGSDYSDNIITTTDGGYVIVASTSSNDGDVPANHGGIDVWIVKLDASGTIVWSKTFGGSGDDLNDLHRNAIVETNDGGFLFAGYTNSNDGNIAGTNHGSNDAWALKLSGAGDLIWQKTYGGTLSENGNSIIKTAGGNYMICGNTGSTDGDLAGLPNHGGVDCWLFEINDNGDLLWQKTYGGSQNDNWNAIRQASDGGYILSGTSLSNDGDVSGNSRYADAWVVKLYANGNIAWQKFFGGADVDNATVRDIDATGKILLTGYTSSKNGDITGYKGGSQDFWVLQLDGNGIKINSIVLGGRLEDHSEDAIINPDGSYMAIGRTSSNDGDVSGNHGGFDVWMVRFKF
jgi:hypothetical protein